MTTTSSDRHSWLPTWRHRLMLCGVVLATLAATGCDGEVKAPPLNKITRPGPDYTIPPVRDPLSFSRYVPGKACDLLTSEQIEQLRLPSTMTVSPGSACRWKDTFAEAQRRDREDPDPRSFDMTLQKAGLAEAYDSAIGKGPGPDKERSWEPTTFQGYPAAYTRPTRPHVCGIEVGISDTQSFDLSDSGGGYRAEATGSDDPCARVRMAAGFIIENLQKES